MAEPMVVPTVPPRVPMLHADDLPGEDDWALLTALRAGGDQASEHDSLYDRCGSLRLAPAALD
jgi:hypothetical protein